MTQCHSEMANSRTWLIPFTAHWKKWFGSKFLWPRKVSSDYCKIKTPLGGWKRSLAPAAPVWSSPHDPHSMTNCDKWSKVWGLVIQRDCSDFCFWYSGHEYKGYLRGRVRRIRETLPFMAIKAWFGVDCYLNYGY